MQKTKAQETADAAGERLRRRHGFRAGVYDPRGGRLWCYVKSRGGRLLGFGLDVPADATVESLTAEAQRRAAHMLLG